MAFSKAALATSKITLAIQDYSGSPNTVTLEGIEVASVIPVAMQSRGNEEILVNSATGRDIWALLDTGLAGGQDFTFQLVATDPSTSSTSSSYDLLVGLAKDDMTGTSYSAYDFSSQLTGKGKKMAKFIVTMANAAGTSYTCTFAGSVLTAEYAANGEHLAINATIRVLGAPTMAEVV